MFVQKIQPKFATCYSVPVVRKARLQIVLAIAVLLLPAAVRLNSQTIRPPAGAAAADLDAASRGDVSAQLRVAKAFNQGGNGTRDFGKAFKWFNAASSQGSVEASSWLGSMYLQGHGVQQDVARAATLIQSAAAQNDPVGLRFMGIMYEFGQGVPRSMPKAVSAFSKAIAHQDANSCDQLGLIFMRGVGVKRNLPRAARLLTKGARLGDQWAQLHLGELYLGGHVPSRKGMARSAASANSVVVPPTTRTAKPNFMMAKKLFSDSAAQGNRVAAFQLAELYEFGKGGQKDMAKAVQLYSQSAANNYAPAQVALGRLAEAGSGMEANVVEAYTFYSLAAAQDSVTGETRLRELTRKLTPNELQQAQALLSSVEKERKAHSSVALDQQ
jgi:uncharacterized protein